MWTRKVYEITITTVRGIDRKANLCIQNAETIEMFLGNRPLWEEHHSVSIANNYAGKHQAVPGADRIHWSTSEVHRCEITSEISHWLKMELKGDRVIRSLSAPRNHWQLPAKVHWTVLWRCFTALVQSKNYQDFYLNFWIYFLCLFSHEKLKSQMKSLI